MSGTTEKKVRLVFYERINEEIVIDGIDAKEWDDFVIVYIEGEIITNWHDSVNEPLTQALREYANKSGKELVIVPKGSDITFYGIEVDIDE